MKENRIRMLPVMEKGKLVGVVTDRDLKEASASDATSLEIHELLYLISKIKISEIMSRNPVTVPVDYTVEEVAEILLNKRISGAPVVDHDGKVVGTITQTDIFKVLLSLTGLKKKGVSFAFMLEDRPGSIKDVADVIRKYEGRMASILTSYDGVEEGFRKVYIRVHDIDRIRLPQLKEDLQNTAKVLYMVDHRENKREIFD
jgi:acetoin utilization protein AcuB